MSFAVLDLGAVVENKNGWGPLSAPTQASSNQTSEDVVPALPFQQFNKADRIGRVADWIGGDRFYRRGGERYNERVYGSAATAGSQFDYVHEADDSHFQVVDTSRPVTRGGQRGGFRARQLQFRRLLQNREDRREQQNMTQNQRMKRSIAKEQQRALKLQQRRGGGGYRTGGPGRGGGRYGDRAPIKERPASISVRPEWRVLEELDFPRLQKLTLPGVTAQDVEGHQYGTLHYYDRTVDRVSVKAPVALQRCGGTYYNATTTDDPVIQQLSQQGIGHVFATDIILATLMTAPRSVYSWDIIAHRVGNKLFFDKRDISNYMNPVDALTVSETSVDPPPLEPHGINNARDLATEALYINQNFRRQVLKRHEEPYKFDNPRAPFDEEGLGDIGTAYRYRKFTLGGGAQALDVVVRTEHDGVFAGPNNEVQTATIKAFNEWDSSLSGGVDWRSKLDSQKGAVLATELKNNSCKLAKWTLQALLAGSDQLKLGYVSRVNVRNSAQHVILGTQQMRPADFATSISLNVDNAWGILRVIVDLCMKKPPGKYLLLKDPLHPTLRLYGLPDGTFDSDSDEDDEEEEDDEQ